MFSKTEKACATVEDVRCWLVQQRLRMPAESVNDGADVRVRIDNGALITFRLPVAESVLDWCLRGQP